MLVRCLVPVPAGAELTIAYLDLSQPSRLRRTQLLDKYMFSCDCARCARHDDPADQPDPAAAAWHHSVQQLDACTDAVVVARGLALLDKANDVMALEQYTLVLRVARAVRACSVDSVAEWRRIAEQYRRALEFAVLVRRSCIHFYFYYFHNYYYEYYCFYFHCMTACRSIRHTGRS